MRGAAIATALIGVVLLGMLAASDPRAAADGWRAAFLLLQAPPVGAVTLLLIARVVGADWDAALQPLLAAVPWLILLAIPVVIGQALFHRPDGHLNVWLSPVFFGLRTLVALGFWSLVARAELRGAVTQAGPLLLAHGVVVSVMGYDWLLGSAPAQPNSAAPMLLAVMQIGGAAALACAAALGRPEQRRDLAYLVIAAGLGLAYLVYIDFAIVWFGNLPAHVGWYVARNAPPAALLPGAALLLGLLAPILLIGLARSDAARRWAGWCWLAALGLLAIWFVAGDIGWLALLAACAGVMAAGSLARAVRA